MIEAAQSRPNTRHSFVSAEAIRVLLIDDDEDDAMITQTTLTQVRGVRFETEWASTYQQGLQKLKENSHAICLLDYSLGQKTGLDILAESLQFGCRIPIIMMTVATDREIDLQAITLGAADYIIKGETNPGVLERVIRHARERHKASLEREALTQQLVESSRRLGMAEVASDVLHNVGNVLNSLNVSAGLIAQHVREMPVHDVNRISDLLAAHQDDIGTFLTHDSKGQQVLGFLAQLGCHLRDQHAQTCSDLDTLISQIDHVRDLIVAQDDIARATSIQEPVVLKDLVETALATHSSELDKNQIVLIRDYADMPQIITDKQQVSQIVANLIANATEAMQQQVQEPHQLTVRTQLHTDEDNRIRLQMIDSGIGISSDNLQRIFAQSLVPERGKQGSGLHNNANAAKNLGGSLTAASDGEGLGATFTLELPITFLEIPG